MSNSLDRLERKLGYTFKDRDLMVLALTHRSYAALCPLSGPWSKP